MPEDEQIKALIGYTLEDIFIDLKVDANNVSSYVETYKSHYAKIANKKTFMLPNAIESLLVAYEFANLGIVTTKTSLCSKEILDHLGAAQYFQVIIGREDVVNPKPSAEPINKALLLMNADNKNTWMIGDTILDLLAAQNSNVKSIGVLCGYGLKKDLEKLTKNIAKDTLEAVLFIRDNFTYNS